MKIYGRYSQLDTHWSNRNDFFSDNTFFSSFQKKIGFNALNLIFNNQGESKRLLKNQDFDIFHPTYYDPYFLKYLQRKHFVLTVYDMIHERFPNYFRMHDPIRDWKKQLLENAHSIIAISENTRKDIIKFCNIDPDRIQIIHLGNPFENMDEIMPLNNSSLYPVTTITPYLLFVGTRSGYKNFIFFIESVSEILKRHDELHIYCAGGEPFSLPEKKILQKLNIFNKVHHIQVKNYQMTQLYRDARAFIFPSLYEGFGLPVLEAFSCECPAILSNTSALPEVGGDAALYFDPLDSLSLSNAVERIISDVDLRTRLIQKGNERVKLFSWRKTADLTKNVYENTLNRSDKANVLISA